MNGNTLFQKYGTLIYKRIIKKSTCSGDYVMVFIFKTAGPGIKSSPMFYHEAVSIISNDSAAFSP